MRPLAVWLLLLVFSMATRPVSAQFFTGFSKMIGGNQVEEVFDMQTKDGDTYLLGTTRSANFPSTNGSTYKGNLDMTLTRFDGSGNILYATYIGGLGNDFPTAMEIINGEVFITLYTDSINFPVTNGSVFRGRRDIVALKINAGGNIQFATYLGGSANDIPAFKALRIVNNRMIIAGTTSSSNFPVTIPTFYQGGVSDTYAAVLDAQTGNLLASRFWGGNKEDFLQGALFDNNSIYLLGSSKSSDIPCSIGGPLSDSQNIFLAKMNVTDLGVQYSRYLGGSKEDQMTQFIMADSMLQVTGYTSSADFPSTNGTTATSVLNDLYDGFFTRFNPDGNIQFSSYLTTEDRDNPVKILTESGNTYVGGTSVSIDGKKFLGLFKIGQSGNILYNRKYQIGTSSNNNITPSFNLVNDGILISGITLSPAYPVSNGSQFFSSGTGFFTNLDRNGFISHSTYLGNMTSLLPLLYDNGLVYLAGQSSIATYPSTNGSTPSGGADNHLIILKPDGNRVYAAYFGGSADDQPKLSVLQGSKWLVAGKTISANYPVTVNQLNRGNGDQYLTMINSCPSGYRIDIDQLLPDSQSVCKTGLGLQIAGPEIQVPGDSLPILYRSGTAFLQQPIAATYQWQTAFTMTGPWSDIPGATFRNYTPTLGSANQYYRRASYTQAFCGSSFIHYSDTSVALVNDLVAPVIDPGGNFVTCPGFPVTIGGNPTAGGGNPPYVSFDWDQGAASLPNPVVQPQSNTLYTVTVTDSLGCRQAGQALVLTYRASAGPDKGACGNEPALIGTPRIPGLNGLQYNWLPGTTLNDPTLPQPSALPASPTDYELTLTVPVSGGGQCQTTDTVRVTPVAAPITANFAGSDKVFCLGSSVLLGAAPEAGFNYVWSPGSYLTSNNASTTTYYAGNLVMPVPNPANINVTAQKAGCFFPDQATVATIEARAGRDGCGPRLVGLPDRTPGINETYSWSIVSGPGNFTGPTNLPQIPVSASANTPTTYRLTVTYNGQSCTDDVTVPPFCSDCQTQIFVDAQYSCPSYTANGGNVTLYAVSSIENAIYRWSPQEGLSNYTGNLVQLTDGIPRIYTVTAYDPFDSTRTCTDRISVNDPSFVKPIFPAADTITCAGQPVMIGAPNVAGYSYQWTGAGLSSNLISNPVATINSSTSYPVVVSDTAGCILRDTVLVVVQNALVNAGPDKFLCSSGIVRLGTPAQPNTTYLWEPEASPWQNNSNQFSAQPDVFVATDVSFIVTATTSAGCIIRDTVSVSINDIPVIPDAPDTSTCLGTGVRIGSPAISGVTYQWSPAAGLSSSTVAQPIANPSSTTTYTVIAGFPGNCASLATDQVTVTVKSAAFSMPDISYCPSAGPVELGIQAPPNMISYAWQPQQAVSNAAIANPSTQNPPPKVATNFTLLVTHPNGCQYRDTIQIIPSVSAPQAGADRTICKGDSIMLGTSANSSASGISYSWSPALYLDDPASPTPQFTAEAGGVYMYILTKTDQTISCFSKDTIIITVQDISFSMNGNPIVCQNSCIQVGTNPVAGINYQWSPAAGLSDPFVSNPLACLGTGTASYTLTASNLTGCRVSQDLVIGVSPLPAAQISIPDITGCTGDSTLQFNPVIAPPGPYRYLWSPDDGSLSDIRIVNPRIRLAVAGNRQYQLLVSDTVSGCTNTARGNLQVTNCVPAAIIGDLCWFDQNSNGLQDIGEPGISGIQVRLFNAAGFNVATSTTNPSGLYYFTNIIPGNGYYMTFSLPAGYMFTEPLVGGAGSDINSKVNDTGRSIAFSVLPGSTILNMDAGIRICGNGGPVPVTLLSFTASPQKNAVFLFWQTAAEYQNDHFAIERSINGRDFIQIGRMAGHGTTSLAQHYKWIDDSPVKGMNFYRLRQVDTDNRFQLSRVIPVKFGSQDIVNAYYVPATHSIMIQFSVEQPPTLLMLLSSAGQRVTGMQTADGTLNVHLSLPVLADGVYTLVIGNREMTYSRQILIGK